MLRKRKGPVTNADKEQEAGAAVEAKDLKEPRAGNGKEAKPQQQERKERKEGKEGKEGEPQLQGQKQGVTVPSAGPGAKGKPRRKCGVKWCLDSCCWLIGYGCVTWWLILVIYNALPSLPQYVTEVITGPLPDPPGLRLAKEGLRAKHPVVFVPGIVTGGLELWEGHPCMEGLFRKRLWGGTFGEVYKRPKCWMEHMQLNNETGLDPQGIRVRPVSGLVAADYFAPGYFVWAVLIENLARLGYEERSLYMASYDWRLSFQNTEVRDKSLSRMKSTIELLYNTNEQQKVVVIPHSMGSLYFLHFIKWVEAPLPMGGGGGPTWCAKYLKTVLNIGGPFLGVPKAFTGLFSAEAKDIAVARAIAPGVLDSDLFGLQTLQHMMRVTRTWDSTMSMLPRGGEVVWGGADWSPEEGYDCTLKKSKGEETHECVVASVDNCTQIAVGSHGKPLPHYGRIVSFGKSAAHLPSKDVLKGDLQDVKDMVKTGLVTGKANISCGEVWTEYHDISWDVIQAVENHGIYTSSSILDLLRVVAPRMMHRADATWSYGVADDPSDPKYGHHKYWSNPLETTLPNAPDMEVFCMYGTGILTERSYIYKLSPSSDTCYIPFRIDTSADGDSEGCLKGGVHFVDGDETVPTLSAGFMCAKGWRGKTKYNPSGVATYVREYDHAPPSNMILEGRGTQSGSHVDVLGNFGLLDDVLRIVAGASGEEIGGDRLYSDLQKWADRIPLKV